MSPRPRKSTFGSIRLQRGRWQARVTDPRTGDRVSLGTWDGTADGRAAAEQALAEARVEHMRGTWVSPRSGAVSLADYWEGWFDSRPGGEGRPALAPTTQELYEWLWRTRIAPAFGAVELSGIRSADVRRWRAAMAREGIGANTMAKAYRLLKSVMATAVEDGLIVANPCAIKGAGTEHAPERNLVPVPTVTALAEAMPERFRLAIWLGVFSTLRIGEVLGLQRQHVLDGPAVRIDGQLQEVKGGAGGLDRRAPKTRRGERTVHLPSTMAGRIDDHIAAYVGPDANSWVFTGIKGGPVRRPVWNKAWRLAREDVGVGFDVRYHDLRHTGATLLAQHGATTAELMSALGHSDARTALGYQHVAEGRLRTIADKMADGFG